MGDLVLPRPDLLADSTVGAGFLLSRGQRPGIAARLELTGPLDLSPAAARHLASWLAAYAEAAELPAIAVREKDDTHD
jgi:hypothetical protein